MHSSKWVVVRKPEPAAKLKLICFPYAGGDANVYVSWVNKIHPAVEVLAIQAPGRANRISEPALRSMDEIITLLCSELTPFLDRPYAVLGHSLGARIAFEFTHQTRIRCLPEPLHYFGSASKAPHLACLDEHRHELPDEEFIEVIKDLGGTPREVIENKALIELVLPMLRADFFLADTYLAPVRPPLDIPATLFNGVQDYDVNDAFRAQWQRHFSIPLDFEIFDSGHFFINDMREEYLAVLNMHLTHIIETNL